MQPIPISTTCKSASPMHRLPIPVLWVQQILHCALLGLWTMVCWAAYTDTAKKKKKKVATLSAHYRRRQTKPKLSVWPVSCILMPCRYSRAKRTIHHWRQPERPCSGTQPSLRPKEEGEKWSETTGFRILVHDLYLPPTEVFQHKEYNKPTRKQNTARLWFLTEGLI